MKRYLILLPSDLTGGAEKNLYKIADQLLTEGCYVDVVFLSNLNNVSMWDDLQGATLNKFKSKRESIGVACVFLWLAKRKVVGNVNYDAVFSSHVHCNAFLSFLCKIKLLVTDKVVIRESTQVFSWFSGTKLLLIKILYLFYDRKATIICQTNEMKNELIFNIPKLRFSDVRFVRNPVAHDVVIKKSQLECDVCNEIKVYQDQGYKVIVSVGRLVEEKGFDILISSLKFINYPCILIIVGNGYLRKRLEELVVNENLDKKVIFTGELENPFPLMKVSDLSVVSSRLEGFPNVLLEMMALSPRRVVTTRCADGIDDLPGILSCKVDDTDDLAKAINLALGENDNFEYVVEMKTYVQSLKVSQYVTCLLN
ncbi:glycosyl transferase, group 1 [Vibrio ichthyoenteri ATCC 700023]|uniref:Glycosyl transferase, group 1 n=1 Tax=Vibrio ichthyoenteri ATCC 700023 TaxID=870968 RepID=F9S4N7_9VIBR|nr:glycosyltransferase [Vibrio ichthyoenteri]EGU36727.1 glycosyl transferase, group 1 [Vibrio ichthyoenteri ATCC 700023]